MKLIKNDHSLKQCALHNLRRLTFAPNSIQSQDFNYAYVMFPSRGLLLRLMNNLNQAKSFLGPGPEKLNSF